MRASCPTVFVAKSMGGFFLLKFWRSVGGYFFWWMWPNKKKETLNSDHLPTHLVWRCFFKMFVLEVGFCLRLTLWKGCQRADLFNPDPPWKTTMRMEDQPFEDVSHIKNGNFPCVMLIFEGYLFDVLSLYLYRLLQVRAWWYIQSLMLLKW